MVDASAQSSTKSFFRRYGLSNSDYGTWAIETSDQGYLILLNSPANVPLNTITGAGIIKTDCMGEIQWQHLYSSNNESMITSQALEYDGEYYVYGSAVPTSQNSQLFIARLSADGVLQQIKFIQISVSDLSARFLHDSDGSWWLLSTGDNNVNYENINVTHLDPNFNLINSKKISLPQKELEVKSATFSPDGEIVICGDYSGHDTFRNGFVMRISTQGELRWFSSLTDTYDVYLNDIVSDAAGYCFISGYVFKQNSGWDALCAKVNVFGNYTGQVLINMSEDDKFRAIAVRGSDILLAGDFGNFDDRNIFWLKINSTTSAVGDPLQLDYGNPYTNYPYSLVTTSSNGWLITGDFSGNNSVRDAGLIRLDTYFQLPCNTMGVDFYEHNLGDLTPGTEAPSIQNTSPVLSVPELADAQLIYLTSELCGKYSPVPNALFEISEDCPLSCVTFTDKSICNPLSWSWEFPGGQPASSTEQNPTVCYNSQGNKTATLRVTNNDGTNTMTFDYKIEKECPLIIPNTFSPNGDGSNDVFQIIGLKDNSTFHVYDRWGKIVYGTENYLNNWTGKFQPDQASEAKESLIEGVYYYVLVSPDGIKSNGFIQLVH